MEFEEQLKERYYKIFSDLGAHIAKTIMENKQKLYDAIVDETKISDDNLSYEIPYEIKAFRK